MVPTRRDILHLAGATSMGALAGCYTNSQRTDDLCGDRDNEPESTSTISGDGTATAPPLPENATWPTGRYDARNTGFVPDATGPVQASFLWRAPTPGEGLDGVAPVVADGTVYVTDQEGDLVVALNPRDGSERWRTNVDSPAPPTVHEETLYVGGRRGLYALDTADGDEQWAFTPEMANEDDLAFGCPHFADGLLYVAGAGGTYAVSTDGEQHWHAPYEAIAHLGAVADGRVFVDAGTLRALDATTGAELWTYPHGAYGELAVADGTVYTHEGYEWVYALDASDGAEQWSFQGELESFSASAVTDDTLYLASASMEGPDGENIYALNRMTGEPRWCAHLGGSIFPPVATPETVFLGTNEGLLQARAARDGALRWQFYREFTWFTSLAVADNRLFAGSGNDGVYAFGPPA